MYYASIIVCWLMLGSGKQCAVAEDMYSPHPTVEACQSRLEEMQAAIADKLPFIIIVDTECAQKGTAA